MCGPAIQVRFRDYGNLAEVDEQFVLPRVEEIPEEDLLANLLDVNLVFKVGLKSFILLVTLNISYFSLHVQRLGWKQGLSVLLSGLSTMCGTMLS